MAEKRLSKYDRDVFVRAVLADVEHPPEDAEQARVQDAVVKAMSSLCRKLYNQAPKAVESERVCLYLTKSGRYVTIRTGDAEVNLDEIAGAATARERQQAFLQFKAAVDACRTAKDLSEAFPELARYVPSGDPASKPVFPVAPANLYAALVGFGLKKG